MIVGNIYECSVVVNEDDTIESEVLKDRPDKLIPNKGIHILSVVSCAPGGGF